MQTAPTAPTAPNDSNEGWPDHWPAWVTEPLDKSKANVSHLIKVAVGVTKSAANSQEHPIETLADFIAYLGKWIRAYGVSVKTTA